MKPPRRVEVEPSPKRVRVMANGRTVADSLASQLLLETGHHPVYYFPRADVRAEALNIPLSHGSLSESERRAANRAEGGSQTRPYIEIRIVGASGPRRSPRAVLCYTDTCRVSSPIKKVCSK